MKKKTIFLLSVLVLQQCHWVFGALDEYTTNMDTGGLSRDSFPKGFTFGTASSAYQVEGMAHGDGRGPSIWDVYVEAPGHIADNDTGIVADDQYNRYKEDIDMMADLNFDAYRFSISWSRIFPEGEGKINWLGVDYYNRLIDYMLEKGITPYANLYHYDLPNALEEKYLGWLNRKVVNAYIEYADFCFKMFGNRVKYWFTFNEPRIVAALGYDNGINPPCRCSKKYGNCTAGDSANEPYTVAHNLLLSHAGAVHRYRTKYKAEQQGVIGILLDFVWYEPLTNSTDDQEAAQRARDFHLGWFLNPIMYGAYPEVLQKIVAERLPKFTKKQIELVKGSVDIFGINEYTAFYMYDPHQPQPPPNDTGYQADWNVGFAFDRDGVPIGPRAHTSWLYVVPWAMYKVATYVKEHYGNPTFFISENGMDDPGNVTLPTGMFDNMRVGYFKGYISELKKAIDDGAKVTGYFAWSIIDNFEWLSGYTSRFGMVYIDRNDNLKRYPKMSAYWFKKMLQRKH